MPRKPIEPRVTASGPPGAPSELREALARWATGVAVLAVRHEGDVIAMTVTAFMPLSLDPPLVGVAVSEHAPVATLLDEGTDLTVSILGGRQRRWANVFADSFATDRSGFPPSGDAALSGAIATLSGRVTAVHAAGDHRLVVAAVERVTLGEDEAPLLYFQRAYRALPEE